MADSLVRLKTVFSPQYDTMFHTFFLPSLRRVEPNVDFEAFTFQIGGNAQFGSPEFKAAQIIKWQHISTWLEGDVPIVFCDVDLFFIRPFISQLLKDCEGVDFATQEVRFNPDSKPWANVGFMFMRPVKSVRDFVSTVIERTIRTKQWEESIANRLLNTVSYRGLPLIYASNYAPVPEDAVLFHPVPTYRERVEPCLQQKMEMLSAIQARFSTI